MDPQMQPNKDIQCVHEETCNEIIKNPSNKIIIKPNIQLIKEYTGEGSTTKSKEELKPIPPTDEVVKIDKIAEVFYHNVNNVFSKNLKSYWDFIHNHSNVFRYSITQLQERFVDDNYLLQLNPDRGSKRRLAQDIKTVSQTFDPNKFNFTKISSDEVIYEFLTNDCDERHVILVNVSPISRYHSLLCPSIDQCLPQVVTEHSLVLALSVMFMAENRDIRIGFNSLCGFASINHLHYHILFEPHVLPIEKMPAKHLKGDLHILDENSTVPAFCYQIKYKNKITVAADSIHKLTNYLVQNNIAHNLMISRGDGFDDGDNEVIRVVVWPRISNYGVKQFSSFNVALCELAGWFPVYDEHAFETLNSEEIGRELKKWAWPNFDNLCDKVASLY